MSPWTLLGWILVAVVLLALATVALVALRFGLAFARARLGRWLRWRRSRKIAPAVGQRWEQEGSVLEIRAIYDTGVIGISSGCASWGDTPERWRERVDNRRLILLSNPSAPASRAHSPEE